MRDRENEAAPPALDRALPSPRATRFEPIDLLRGLVIALMVLDHTRDFFHDHAWSGYSALDLDHTTPATYATRWITHLCAPTFVFLAGVSAFLRGHRAPSRRELSLYLLTRGLWIVLLELTVSHWFGWWFHVTIDMFALKVLWALGASMIVLAALIWLPRAVIAGVGLAIVLGHNLLDHIEPADWGEWAPLWRLLHVPGRITEWTAISVRISYPLIPWIGVMALGYAFGPVLLARRETRRRVLLGVACAALATFVVLRFTGIYGDPEPWTPQDGWLRSLGALLDVAKYPPSLSYLLVTLGLAFLLWWMFERGTPPTLRWLLVFGATPLFTYLVHLPLIHGLSALVHELARGDGGWLFGQRFLDGDVAYPPGFGLGITYFAWICILLLLYPACRALQRLKQRRRDWWLGYL